MHNRLHFEEELDLTPLIDVAFLLQIFFMVTATIDMASSITMPSARHGQAPDLTTAVYLTVFRTETGPELYLSNGKRENGPVALDKVAAHVQEGITEGKRLVVIKADRDVASGFVEDVAREASRAEGIERFLVGVVDAP
ncbi:ExbD/TolR family protein [Planctomyces sp. SH-PL14]|uniref:ExbD/TolR family protein n=1 Tax=Planctomyces sp. SH-PL14 TaxID=1632864 RepID=UPI0009EDBB2A|nr:biopolymer transporter ExbD [Planctomyces sp. SH-PL14]